MCDSHPSPPHRERKWWQTATIYELYPSSFCDSNSDGIGDIGGILSKVPYLASLGIDAIWLAACHRSGGVDMGYDVVDYRDVDAQYGRVEDVEKLIGALGKVGIRVIMDLVVNHTSDQHAWFRESRSSVRSAKRDWYIWRKGRVGVDGQRLPPNNWESIFTGSAWTYDAGTDEYYLCIFAAQQPDLNWANPAVRGEMHEVMRFWLDKGVAGFRMDVVNIISKPETLLDAAIVNEDVFEQPAYSFYCNGPRVHEYLREMRVIFDLYPGSVSVGEVIVTSTPAIVRDYVLSGRELDMAYVYDLFGIDSGASGKFSARDWKLSEFKGYIVKWQTALAFSNGGWGTSWLESHDSARSVTRFGDSRHQGNPSEGNRFKIAKLLCLLQTSLGGTLFVFQGQEIGMQNLDEDVPISEYADVETQRCWSAIRRHRSRQSGISEEEVDMADVIVQMGIKARDHARAPLPWTRSSEAHPHAGFSATRGKTWTPMTSDSHLCNVEQQLADPRSVLSFWRERLAIRKRYPEALVYGDFEAVASSIDDGPVFAYWRKPLLVDDRKSRILGEGCRRERCASCPQSDGRGRHAVHHAAGSRRRGSC